MISKDQYWFTVTTVNMSHLFTILINNFQKSTTKFMPLKPRTYLLFTHAFSPVWCIFEVIRLISVTNVSTFEMHCNADYTCINEWARATTQIPKQNLHVVEVL